MMKNLSTEKMKKSTMKEAFGFFELILSMITETPEERPSMESAESILKTLKNTPDTDQRPTTDTTEVLTR